MRNAGSTGINKCCLK